MKNTEKTKEQLIEEAEALEARLKELEKKLQEAEKELEIEMWGLKKANEGIKVLYKELERKNEELRKIDRMKSDFVSTVSHELRTPLAIIKEGISLTLDGVLGQLSSEQKEILAMSRDNVDRLGRIINDLLDISKIEAGRVELKRTLVDFSAMTKEVCARWRTEFDKKQQIFHLSVPDEPVYIYVDPDKITQVLNNLISNAIKYTPDKGGIGLEVKDKQDGVEVCVFDTGIGISKEDMPRLFSKFQQFNRTAGPGAKGTGLGLSIVKELIGMHKGAVMAESELDKGSKFIFSLPKMDTDAVFKEYINSKMKEASERSTPLSLIMIYFPGFADIQRELGYQKAHDFLKGVEKTISGALRRQADTVVRDTGELIVLLVDTRKEDADAVRARVENAIAEFLKGTGEEWVKKMSVRVGKATYPDEASDDNALLSKARQGRQAKEDTQDRTRAL